MVKDVVKKVSDPTMGLVTVTLLVCGIAVVVHRSYDIKPGDNVELTFKSVPGPITSAPEQVSNIKNIRTGLEVEPL